METLRLFCHWMENTALGVQVRESLWLFPVIETVHIFGIILLVAATSILDLRLMGLAFKQDTVSKLAERFLPWAWAGFAIQVVTGVLLTASEASKMRTVISSWAPELRQLVATATLRTPERWYSLRDSEEAQIAS